MVVTVPAGEFPGCIEIEINCTTCGIAPVLVEKYWVQPGFMLVKIEDWRDYPQVVTSELKEVIR